jgi:formate dehydrogenase subunit delta
MNIEKLIRMANQIAGFFRSYPEPQAVSGIHDHLVAFWTRGMRDHVLVYADHGGEGLDPLVIEALRAFKTGQSPIEKEVSGPEKVGQLGSDAG